MSKILIVEDESSIAETLAYALETEHFECHQASTGASALEITRSENFDCIVLDVGLPDMSGFDVCREIRRHHHTPILFLSARDSEMDRVLGLEFGADDYVTKPFSPRELSARIRAILRRTATQQVPSAISPQKTQQATPLLKHDPKAMCILSSGTPLDLTAHEYKLLACFMKQPGRTFTREQLLQSAWEDPGSAMDRTIDAHIKTLRAKLRNSSPKLSEVIITKRGLGYSYQAPH